MTSPDETMIDELAADLASAASNLARASGPALDPLRALYALATTIAGLASPVGRIGGTARPETQAALTALRAAQQALHALQKALTQV